MRDRDTGKDLHSGFVCPTCFIEIASANGFSGIWRLKLLGIDLHAIWADADGRTWNDDTHLWAKKGNQRSDG